MEHTQFGVFFLSFRLLLYCTDVWNHIKERNIRKVFNETGIARGMEIKSQLRNFDLCDFYLWLLTIKKDVKC